MFLKSISYSKGIIFQYLNEAEKLNRVVAYRMEEKLYEFGKSIQDVYSFFLNTKCVLSKISFDSKFETVTVSGTVMISHIQGAFTFTHEFKEYGEIEMNALKQQNMLQAVQSAEMNNQVYKLLVSLSDFLEEHLATIIAITSDQMSLFEE